VAKRRPADFDLGAAIRDPSFIPRAGDARAIIELLADDDEKRALAAEKALARLGEPGENEVVAAFPSSKPPLRSSLLRVIGRIARESPARAESGLRRVLLDALADEDARTKRMAIKALGKLPATADTEHALLDVWNRGVPIEHARSLAEALGKIGGPRSLSKLREIVAAHGDGDGELLRIASEGVVKLGRTLGRQVPTVVDVKAQAAGPVRVVFHCRGGLEDVLASEIDPAMHPRVVRTAAVEAELDGPLERLFQPRIALRFGFPLESVPVGSKDGDIVQAVATALTSDSALAIFRAYTRGPIRYRIEWASAGHRRAATFRCAQEIERLRPELVNDPTESAWEAIIVERRGAVFAELWPRGLDDPRFTFRKGDVSGSSHPTIAAALVHVAGVRADDVVWDPFVGAGAELVERARAGPYRALFGSDVDAKALDVARTNLAAAGVTRVDLSRGDARTHRPKQQPTLIVTNPPMGRRVLRDVPLAPLFEAFLEHVAKSLPEGGRLVWMSPIPDSTARMAGRLGLRATVRLPVDMGGFNAELQRLEW
jgi:23S rRNA G2445 N2-methylase RlmL